MIFCSYSVEEMGGILREAIIKIPLESLQFKQ